jgi:hypothetical protein
VASAFIRVLGRLRACWAALALALASGLGACSVELQLSGPRAVPGDLAAASMGLAAFDSGIEAPVPAGRPAAPDGIFHPRAAPTLPRARPRPPVTVAAAPGIEFASGPQPVDARLWSALEALAIAPALGPRALAFAPLPPPPLVIEPP